MIDRPKPWDLPALDAYVGATLTRMGENRDVKTDARGEPLYQVTAAGTLPSGKLRLDFEADLSGIGMPTNAPLTVVMDPQAGPLAWFLGGVLIAPTPRDATPAQAGDALGMDPLLDAHQKWVGRNFGGRGR